MKTKIEQWTKKNIFVEYSKKKENSQIHNLATNSSLFGKCPMKDFREKYGEKDSWKYICFCIFFIWCHTGKSGIIVT